MCAVYVPCIYNAWGVIVSELRFCQGFFRFHLWVVLLWGIFGFGLRFSLLQGFFWSKCGVHFLGLLRLAYSFTFFVFFGLAQC